MTRADHAPAATEKAAEAAEAAEAEGKAAARPAGAKAPHHDGPPVTQAVLLAGGQGSRLRPYTDDRPKPMVEIPGTGTPIIGHQLAWLAAEGVTDAVVSCGHLAEVLQEWLDSAPLPLNVTTVVEHEPLGRGGGLKYAAASLPRADEPWYATNGDIWTRFSLREMAAFHRERDATATLALARPRIPWGAVETNEFGQVLDFIEAPPSPFLINAGVYVFAPSFTAQLPDRGDHERTTFPRLARERRLAGFPIPQGAYWRAIDTAKDLTEAAKELSSRP
ncbi:Nucleotidyl transferase [Actinacidiphila alni]|uniref:Nucleotidyl transferase n=1 Tax=Actinacidiphila alni TaxID=380248 RepID=A0A1I2KTD3_9ACTN|nr:nucleotidyltransferase family protein [Actinacidiphila alni]SFF68351.1 Nucleotidyl transferase [Actinacidiphila alni]